MQHHSTKKAFSLIELSVVLAILALITGGILAGQNLLNNANLRDSYIQAQAYGRMVEQFNDKYSALPGDMYNATNIWGAEDAGDGIGADCYDVASTGKATCNGNGDGLIGPSDVAGNQYEVFRAWQHLVNAGFVEGNFTGRSSSVLATAPYHTTTNSNVPAGPRLGSPSSYNIRYEIAGGSHYAESVPHHYVILGTQNGTNYNDAPVMSAAEAYNIDRKIDDSLPGQGKVVTYDNSAQSDCASTDVAATAIYDRDNEEETGCVLFFRIRTN